MNIIRRAILAFALMAGIAPAFAQAPPPVPALPDTERRTSYTISGTTCACAVNFALYGDSTDVDEWIQVWVGGVRKLSTDPTFGWSLSSPTGSLLTIPRPITDAVLTFNAVQTGTVQIVGARRPRRVSQFTENRGVAARDLNQALTDIIAQNRENWDKTNDLTGRGIFFAPGNTTGPMPSPTVCANALLGFDVTGLNPLCEQLVTSGTLLTPGSTTNGDLATFNSTNGKSLGDSGIAASNVPTLSGINAYSGDAYFGSGRPWFDVRSGAHGCAAAVGNGSTDDTSAIQCAINYMATTFGSGTVFFPPGSYCVFSGITVNSYTTGDMVLLGSGIRNSNLSACGHNVTVLTIGQQFGRTDNLAIYGYGMVSTDTVASVTTPAVSLQAGASYWELHHMLIQGGSFPIQAACSGCRIEDVTEQYGYGDGSGTRAANAFVLNSGQYWFHDSFDQVLPCTNAGLCTSPTNPTFPTSIGTWTASHSYTSGTVVTAACGGRTFYIQAASTGISGGSTPPCKPYLNQMTDTGVLWWLVAPDPFYAMQVDSGSNEVIVDSSDMTGWFTDCFAMTNTFAVTAPQNVRLHSVTPGGCYGGGYYLAAGSYFTAEGGDFQGCIQTGCAGAFIPSTWSGPAKFNGIDFHNSMAYGFLVGSSVINLTLTGNWITSATTNAVTLTGSNDYITAVGNTCYSNTGGLSGSPGTHGTFTTGPGNNPGC